MPRLLPRTDKEDHGSSGASTVSVGERRRVVVSKVEEAGIRRILDNPEPPTDALRAAFAEHDPFVSDQPDEHG